ncbi:MAG: RluA family pseudouridine synthase [Bacteroidales bacterium]|jgi:23S rRNA pseudouridine1911/1915/1917 synthase|nr:RluA family pseudouridine synthase [Bacteroidales bacterium]
MSEERDNSLADDADAPDELFEHFHISVDMGQSPVRMDKFLAGKIINITRTRIQQAAEAGYIRVNGVPEKSNYRIKPADEISIVLDYPRHEFSIVPENIPLNIVYEDDILLVVNKPAGLVVHPGHGNYTGTLVNGLAYYFRDLLMFQGDDPRPGLVHRIDKDTSGLLVVAKTEFARAELGRQFFEKSSRREYIALLWGRLKEPEGTIAGHIGRNPKNRQTFTVFPDGSNGKPAVTHYRTLEEFGYTTLVECRLETGRTHQIRVHTAHIGLPVFNDATYGGNRILWGTDFPKYRQFVQNCFTLLPRQALHAKTLGFTHPVTGQQMDFDSELPDDMLAVIERWRQRTRCEFK